MLRTTVLRRYKARSERVEEGRGACNSGTEVAGEGEAGLLVKATVGWVLI